MWTGARRAEQSGNFPKAAGRFEGAGSILAGEKLSVVGVNGNGKTTMIKLLCRLYDANRAWAALKGPKKGNTVSCGRLRNIIVNKLSGYVM